MLLPFNVAYRPRTKRLFGSVWDPSLELIRYLAQGRPVFTADLYVVDGGSGKTRAVVDWNDNAHWLDQANTTLQCVLPTADATMLNKLTLAFTGAESYVSNRASTYWSICHDGGGVDLWTTFRTTADATFRVLWSTTTNSNARGANIIIRSPHERTEFGRSGGSVIPDDATSRLAHPVNNTPHWNAWGHGTALSPDFRHQRSGSAAVTRDYASAPDAPGTAPTFSFTLGAAGGNPSFVGALRSLVVLPAVSASSDALMQKWVQQETGVAA